MDIYAKIVCTLGPAVQSFESVCKLIKEGMNVARINFSHGDYEEYTQWVEWIKKARENLKLPCAILADTKGNEIRIKNLPKNLLPVKEKDLFTICVNPSGNKQFSLTSFHLLTNVQVGVKIVFGDGELYGKCVDVSEGLLIIEMQVDGTLRANMGCSIVGTKINFPIITKKDIEDITFACEMDVDIIAASFVSNADTVLRIKSILKKNDKEDITIISKIESHEGINNINSIIQVSDGIMIARGDLGVELGANIGKIPHIQKTLIKKTIIAGKTVIVATQFLSSMAKQKQPTRAEVSDIVNAIYDGASALMLSSETATGKYPFETLKVMRNVIRQAESEQDYKKFVGFHVGFKHHVSSAVALAAVKTAKISYAKAMFIFSSSGFMARMIAKFRPNIPILVLADSIKTYHKISIVWGVRPFFNYANTQDTSLGLLKDYAIQKELVKPGDIVVVTTGAIFGKSGATNMLIVESIGKDLIRSHIGYGEMVRGKISLFEFNHSNIDPESILVIPSCSPEDTVIMQQPKGVIIANHPLDKASYDSSMSIAKEYNLSVIPNLEEAFDILKDGEYVTIDPSNGHIFKEESSEDS